MARSRDLAENLAELAPEGASVASHRSTLVRLVGDFTAFHAATRVPVAERLGAEGEPGVPINERNRVASLWTPSEDEPGGGGEEEGDEDLDDDEGWEQDDDWEDEGGETSGEDFGSGASLVEIPIDRL